CSPHTSVSSPVLPTTVSSRGARHAARPRSSLAAPVPPASAVTLTGAASEPLMDYREPPRPRRATRETENRRGSAGRPHRGRCARAGGGPGGGGGVGRHRGPAAPREKWGPAGGARGGPEGWGGGGGHMGPPHFIDLLRGASTARCRRATRRVRRPVALPAPPA